METFWINSRLFYQVHIQAPRHQDPLTLKHFRALWRAWIRWIHWRGPFHRALLTCTPLSTGPQKEPWQVTHWMVLSTVHIGRDRWIAQYNDTLGTLCTYCGRFCEQSCMRTSRAGFLYNKNTYCCICFILWKQQSLDGKRSSTDTGEKGAKI